MRDKKEIMNDIKKILLEIEFAKQDEDKKQQLQRIHEELKTELKALAKQEIGKKM